MNSIDTSEEGVKNFGNLLDFLKRLASDGITSLIENQILQMLDYSVPFFATLVRENIFEELKRLSINKNVIGANKRIYDINNLKYPPPEKVKKYGRCNLPGQSILYSSFMMLTAISEMRPSVGDLVTESTWRVKENQSLKYCPIFKNQPTKENLVNIRLLEINSLYEEKLKTFPENVWQQVDSLVQFVADAFTKYVNPTNHLDYIFSAYFSNKIFHDFEDGRIEAIYYPSVKEKLTFENLAIKPDVFDKKYDLIKVHDYVVVASPASGAGGYFMNGIGECKKFDLAGGKILWDTHPDKLFQAPEKLKEMRYLYGIDLEGIIN